MQFRIAADTRTSNPLDRERAEGGTLLSLRDRFTGHSLITWPVGTNRKRVMLVVGTLLRGHQSSHERAGPG